MNRITGRSAFLALLKDEGITHLFGNPGTTELPIMHALKDHPDLTYVMAMQESLVVAIADGFSRASGRLVACNVHVAPGLGNAMGSLYNAQFTGTPMILTAGQQEQGHGLMEPLLYGPLVRMAEPLVKWAVEVTRLEDLPRIVRRAAKIATTPPTGPVFISLPGDILNAEAGIELGASTRVDTRVRPSDDAVRALAQRLLRAERPVIIVGDEILYVARSSTNRRIMSVDLSIGTRLPAYCTSMGRVMLAHLPPADLDAYLARVKLVAHTNRTLIAPDRLRRELAQVAASGRAIVDQELELGLRSIAVPVRDLAGKVVAAMNISTQASRVTIAELERRFLPELTAAARELQTMLL